LQGLARICQDLALEMAEFSIPEALIWQSFSAILPLVTDSPLSPQVGLPIKKLF
jgi:hypothetical protein